MATRTSVTRICDLTGATEDVENVQFSLNGANYSVDLDADSRNDLHDFLADYIKVATRERTTHGRTGTPKKNAETAAAREWAKENGLEVADRGRVSSEILEQYRAARVA